MSKTQVTYCKYTKEALSLMGKQIELARKEAGATAQELSERVGISRELLRRVEKGDPKCSIGVVFELASVLQIPLFYEYYEQLKEKSANISDKIALLPKYVRKSEVPVDDNF